MGPSTPPNSLCRAKSPRLGNQCFPVLMGATARLAKQSLDWLSTASCPLLPLIGKKKSIIAVPDLLPDAELAVTIHQVALSFFFAFGGRSK